MSRHKLALSIFNFCQNIKNKEKYKEICRLALRIVLGKLDEREFINKTHYEIYKFYLLRAIDTDRIERVLFSEDGQYVMFYAYYRFHRRLFMVGRDVDGRVFVTIANDAIVQPSKKHCINNNDIDDVEICIVDYRFINAEYEIVNIADDGFYRVQGDVIIEFRKVSEDRIPERYLFFMNEELQQYSRLATQLWIQYKLLEHGIAAEIGRNDVFVRNAVKSEEDACRVGRLLVDELKKHGVELVKYYDIPTCHWCGDSCLDQRLEVFVGKPYGQSYYDIVIRARLELPEVKRAMEEVEEAVKSTIHRYLRRSERITWRARIGRHLLIWHTRLPPRIAVRIPNHLGFVELDNVVVTADLRESVPVTPGDYVEIIHPEHGKTTLHFHQYGTTRVLSIEDPEHTTIASRINIRLLRERLK